jgi:cyclopropane fatty-acyl-phospholipid synthase-like methyltransferase
MTRRIGRTAGKVPERLAWAVALLDIGPADRLLEIGCGRGVALALACEGLAGGSIVAIDRSPVMTAAARKRNAAHIAAGKASVRTVALADAKFGGQRFDKIFAVNVNLFWTGRAVRELAVIRTVLAKHGALYLFYELPSAAQLRATIDTLRDVLERNGFAVRKVTTDLRHRAPLLCVVAEVPN